MEALNLASIILILLGELGGVLVRTFVISSTFLLVHEHGAVYRIGEFVPIITAVYFSVYATTIAFPKRKFNPIISLLSQQESIITLIEIVGQIMGAFLGAILVNGDARNDYAMRSYMSCGGFYYQDLFAYAMNLSIVGSIITTVGFKLAQNKNIDKASNATFIAGNAVLATIICYPIGGHIDMLRWFGLALVRDCWNFNHPPFQIAADGDGVQTNWIVYGLGSCAGTFLGVMIYLLVFRKDKPKQDKSKKE